MKLSEFTTEEGMDILCEITPYLNNIATDEELMAELKNKVKLENPTKGELMALGVQKLNVFIPIIFHKRKEDVLNILAILNKQDVETIRKQAFFKTVKQIWDCYNDKELMSFFD